MSYKIESPLPVIEGGTGVQSNTPYAVLCGGTIGTAPIQSITSVGTAGDVLTSNGPGLLPTFQNVGIDALVFASDSGTANPFAGLINIVSGNASLNAGSSVLFAASGSTVQLDVTDTLSNTIIGSGAGNLTLSGDNNTILGKTSGQDLTSGTDNAFLGFDAGASLLTGSFNVLLGSEAGSSYTSSESSNIAINASGTAADAHTLRIGSATGTGNQELNQSFIQGIFGINSASSVPVFINSSGQLGTLGGVEIAETFAGDTGTATPFAGLINIIAGTSSQNSGSTVSFDASGSTIEFNISAANNTIVGNNAGNSSITGVYNNALGISALHGLTIGNQNNAIGYASGEFITSGSQNTLLGHQSGSAYASSESNNINIGYSVNGVLGESNVIRIGNASNNQTFITGIDSVNVGSVATVVTEAGNKLGTAVITAGTGITVTPGANLITIATTALTAAITSITGDTGGAQTGPAITFAGGTTGLSFGGSANTITTTFAGITANGGTVSLATDATASALNIGTGAGVKTLVLGSINTTSISTLQSGTAGIFITATNGVITANSGTGTVSISTDATANTVNIGTGAGVKAVTLGSTNTTSALTLNSGSGGITATGVDGVNVGSVAKVVTESGNKLGTAVITAGTGITVTPGANLITIATTALTAAITSITGDTGGAQTGPAITFAGGTTGLSFGGSTNTITTTFAGITANGGTVSLATDATTSAINVGTGAGVKTVIVGSTNTTSSTAIRSGTAGINITANGSSANVTIASGTSGTINVGADANTVTTNIATGSGASTINIATGTSITSTINIGTGSSAFNTINIGTASGVGAFNAVTVGSTAATCTSVFQAGSGGLNVTANNGPLTINSGTGIVGVSTDATNNTVSIGTGGGVKTVTVGSTNTTSITAIKSGTAGITITATNGVITSNSGTGTVGISTDATANTVNIGTGGGVKTVTLGSTNTTSITSIQSGTAGITIGTGAQAKTVAIGSTTGASALTLNSGSGGITAIGVVGVTATAGVPVVISAAGLLGTVVSSERYKHNIQDMNDQSSSILNLRPVTFAYNSDETETKQYGLIAEEVNEIFPDIVVRNKDGQIETVQYHILPALLLNEIKKLNARIVALENK